MMVRLLILLMIATVQLHAQKIEIAVQKGHSGDITAMVFSRDGRLLASAGSDHLIKLWHIPTGKEMASFAASVLYRPVKLEFVGNDNFLHVTYADGSIEKWNIITSSLEMTTKGQTLAKQGTYTSSDGSYSVFINTYHVTKQNSSGKSIFSKVPIDITKNFTGLAVSESLNTILASNEDGSIYAYNLTSGKSTAILEGHYASANVVCFSPGSNFFATGSSDRSIIIWDTKTLTSVKRLAGRSFRYETLAFNHAGTQLAAGDELGFGRVIDLQSSRIKVSVSRWHEQRVGELAFSADDSLIYSGGYDNRLAVYDVKAEDVVQKDIYRNYVSTGDYVLKKLGAYRDPYAWISAVSTSPAGDRVAFGGAWRESTIRKQPQPIVVSDSKGKTSAKLLSHQGTVNDILFLDEQNFLSVAGESLLHWYDDKTTGDFYFIDKKFPGTKNILGVVKGPGNTVLLQTKNMLLHYDVNKQTVLDSMVTKEEITSVAFDPVTQKIAYAMFNTLVFTDLASWHQNHTSITNAHSDRITDLEFNPARPILATCSWDATIKLWDTKTMKLLATIISIGKDDHIIITSDNYYYGTKNSLKGIGFKYGKMFISPEQYDLRFNRPDIVLDRMGYVPKNIVKSFNRAYQKRLQKMNFTEQMLSEEIHLPEVTLNTESLPLTTAQPQCSFNVKAIDSKYPLDRINIFVNNIPVYGLQGISLRDLATQEVSRSITLNLSEGKNKIQVSCLNEKGVESLMQTAEIAYIPSKPVRPDLYLAVISVSEYENASMNLRYARKDGQDLARQFRKAGWFDNIIIDTLFDRRATKENITQLRERLMKTSVDDQVILFVSGHGLLDENLDFYFATHDVDFNKPASRGMRYEDLEGLLDGIPARKKLLLMDACHSGEIDKSSIQISKSVELAKNQRGTIATYSYPGDIESDHYKISITTSFELMQEIFANVSKGSGAVVISAAAGNSYALESDQWKNGVFTYSLLNGLNNRNADNNRNGSITVSELKDYISREVEKLTQGAQRPTSRRENLEFDFRIW